MTLFPKKLREKLARRETINSLRRLQDGKALIDFASNDYLGLSRSREIFERASQLLAENHMLHNGASGSRLLSGNHHLYGQLEERLVEFHQTGAALVFNSGYDANIGFFGCVPQRGDVVFYDEHIHASIRDGIKMGNAKSYKFKHNDLGDLKKKCRRQVGEAEAEVYVVTESVFSMDGDSPDLQAISKFCRSNDYHLIVDEAHAVGVFGEIGEGLVQQLGVQDTVFARIVTFGKAIGCHGAAILGSKSLMDYLVNFARSLIYTTALPPHSVATILSAYESLSASGKGKGLKHRYQLEENRKWFNLKLEILSLEPFFIPSTSAIHCCVIPGNEEVKSMAYHLQEEGFDVRPILSPTVPQGQERLRICLHSFNTKEEIGQLLELLSSQIENP